jgi:hypothetical protein
LAVKEGHVYQAVVLKLVPVCCVGEWFRAARERVLEMSATDCKDQQPVKGTLVQVQHARLLSHLEPNRLPTVKSRESYKSCTSCLLLILSWVRFGACACSAFTFTRYHGKSHRVNP